MEENKEAFSNFNYHVDGDKPDEPNVRTVTVIFSYQDKTRLIRLSFPKIAGQDDEYYLNEAQMKIAELMASGELYQYAIHYRQQRNIK